MDTWCDNSNFSRFHNIIIKFFFVVSFLDRVCFSFLDWFCSRYIPGLLSHTLRRVQFDFLFYFISATVCVCVFIPNGSQFNVELLWSVCITFIFYFSRFLTHSLKCLSHRRRRLSVCCMYCVRSLTVHSTGRHTPIHKHNHNHKHTHNGILFVSKHQ